MGSYQEEKKVRSYGGNKKTLNRRIRKLNKKKDKNIIHMQYSDDDGTGANPVHSQKLSIYIFSIGDDTSSSRSTIEMEKAVWSICAKETRRSEADVVK